MPPPVPAPPLPPAPFPRRGGRPSRAPSGTRPKCSGRSARAGAAGGAPRREASEPARHGRRRDRQARRLWGDFLCSGDAALSELGRGCKLEGVHTHKRRHSIGRAPLTHATARLHARARALTRAPKAHVWNPRARRARTE